ncbi:hypothetical protein [Protaetiibacter larvae]|uniref:Uncharacterized protein n=1 Tax=Protaetiibacter larvae TaxID=2592654 RepID=A0A5C1Y7Q8_9MICO|nr:hypothetical protein [Protaetiibacter larvae]QEO09700.1 hypothetical protein FLP23_06580 [Protaetiibacter larvae]
MSTTPRERPDRIRWHRPLIALAIASALVSATAIVGLVVDPRELVGAPVWAKALKFGLSILIYAVTWAWLIGQLRRFRRIAWWAGTVIAVTLILELGIITLQVARGHRSHYNNANPLDETLWSIMGTAIMVLWLATLVAAVVLWFTPGRDGARTLAVRAGSVLSLVGLGLGFLMTLPTDAQLAAESDIIGAHTVGAEDGGPGLPILGWSTEHGDLRIPHFIGMHALQLIPLALILIELAAARVAVFRSLRTRVGLVWTVTAGYAGVVALVTWQALRGQSIVHPDALTLTAGGAISVAVAAGILLSLAGGRRERTRAADASREDAIASPR